jgi:hypothetical protein
MKDIGLGHRIRGLDGCHLVTTELSSISVTGMEIVAGLNMTTIGTGNATETMIGTATTVTNGVRQSDAHKGQAGPNPRLPKLRSGGNSAAV